MNTAVISILYQTSTGESSEIALPSTPVKPQRSTAMCILISAFFIVGGCKLTTSADYRNFKDKYIT